jgi:hypothetical protein
MLLGPVFLLTGCIGAAVLGVQTAVGTAQGSDVITVVVTPKKHKITSINKIKIDLKKLKLDQKEDKEQYAQLNELLIASLKKNNLYEPDNSNGDTMEISISRVSDNINDTSVQAFVEVFDAKGDVIFSGVFMEIGKGLRQIDYVREQFVISVIKYLKAPIKKK